MSKTNRFEIMEHLANDQTLEMTPYELEQLLNAELDKPADEIDTALVEEILMAMDMPAPDPQRIKADWHIVRKHLPKRQVSQRLPKLLLRACAAAAMVAAILFVPLRDAEAFRWTLIEKILKPVAETFGIVIDAQQSVTPEKTETTLYSIGDAPSTYTAYDSLHDIPETAHGYLIRPKWIPEGFTFSSGSHYSSPDSEIYSMDFANADAWFNFRVYIITQDSTIYSQEFERNVDIPTEKQIGDHMVTFYTNTDDKSQSAFWIHENANYRVIGDLSFKQAHQFIEAME